MASTSKATLVSSTKSKSGAFIFQNFVRQKTLLVSACEMTD
jgi:hypothetical protein